LPGAEIIACCDKKDSEEKVVFILPEIPV